MVDVFREVWRVLRKDGTLWLNLGDSYTSVAHPHAEPQPALTSGTGRTPGTWGTNESMCTG